MPVFLELIRLSPGFSTSLTHQAVTRVGPFAFRHSILCHRPPGLAPRSSHVIISHRDSHQVQTELLSLRLNDPVTSFTCQQRTLVHWSSSHRALTRGSHRGQHLGLHSTLLTIRFHDSRAGLGTDSGFHAGPSCLRYGPPCTGHGPTQAIRFHMSTVAGSMVPMQVLGLHMTRYALGVRSGRLTGRFELVRDNTANEMRLSRAKRSHQVVQLLL